MPATQLPNYPSIQPKVKHGFTLIELLVVIALIGILATFIVASFTSAQQKGRDSKRKSDLDAVKKALEIYKTNCTGVSYYPDPTTTDWWDEAKYAALVTLFNDQDSGAVIRTMPRDPKYANGASPGAYGYQGSGTQASNVCYDIDGAKTQEGYPRFYLRAILENTSDPQAAVSVTRCASSGAVVGPPAFGVYYYVCND